MSATSDQNVDPHDSHLSVKDDATLSHDRPFGRRYWQSLEESTYAASDHSLVSPHHASDEWPSGESLWPENVSRRRFLQLASASAALAGLTGCGRQPEETIVPYVRQPEQTVPGRPKFYATAVTLDGFATGALVESHEGRPTRIEGNPDHPASRGAIDPLTQARILSLYDPDRSQSVRHRGQVSSWNAFKEAIDGPLRKLIDAHGEGLRVLTGTVTSPTLAAQMQAMLKRLPRSKWHQFQPVNRDSARHGALLAFGRDVTPVYDFTRADVVLTLAADFMANGPGSLCYARDFMAGRRVRDDRRKMNRLYAVESIPTLTGTVADHRFVVHPDAMQSTAWLLAQRVNAVSDNSNSHHNESWIDPVARDLKGHRGRCVVVAGREQPAAIHALAHAMNDALGAVGGAVRYVEPIEAVPTDQQASLQQLVDDMRHDRVRMLVILGGNPLYDAPGSLGFERAANEVPLRIHLGEYFNETGVFSHWHIPAAHELETWSDARTYDGTATIMQPMIAPLYDGKSSHELMSTLLGAPNRSSHDLVREHWRQTHGDAGFDHGWRRSLHDGVVADTASPTVDVQCDHARIEDALLSQMQGATSSTHQGSTSTLTVQFRPDPNIHDGRFANNGWLQELPKPLTTLTWDNAVLLSPATADRLSVRNGDRVELAHADRHVTGPVWIMPGHADDCATIHLGYGRRRAGRVGTHMGFDAYALQSDDSPWQLADVHIKRTGRRTALAITQHHHFMEDRDVIRHDSLANFEKNPALRPPGSEEPLHLTLYEPHQESDANAWGMVIDLGACIGCGACTAACQAENNIPIVGKEQVLVNREMHWIRVDRYYEGDSAAPATHHQPVPCMQCENAPCEVVCPVGATVHSDEGLNDMVYNRCIGTRYCSNNCPYKVRRFNFLEYHDRETEVLKLRRNPNVTVRSRGVMEKCTYCVQRLSAARIEAKKHPEPGRPEGFVADGAVRTACQQACPTQAIIFGNLLDAEGDLVKHKRQPHEYSLLEELNTRPRTTYLAKVTNPNPAIETLTPQSP